MFFISYTHKVDPLCKQKIAGKVVSKLFRDNSSKKLPLHPLI